GFTDIGAGLLGASDGSVSWGDYDNDGDFDLLVVGGWTNVYRNDGGGVFTRLEIDFPRGGGQAAWGDYDGDGDLDIAIAVSSPPSSTDCTIYRNTVDAPNDPPDPPAGLAAVVTGAGPVYDVAFGWDPPIDDNTPTPGLTYNLRVVEDSSGIEVMPGMSIVGGANDGERLIPAMGNVQHAGPPSPPAPAGRSWTLHLPAGTYRWSVQAVDTAFAGSTWPAEETVEVPPP
ncbi:MAG: FG-GAP-like repeat-containing protein, partial [Planctomycetota bacterium]